MRRDRRFFLFLRAPTFQKGCERSVFVHWTAHESEGTVTLTALSLRGGAQAGRSASLGCRIITGSCPSSPPWCAGWPGPPARPWPICLGICGVKWKRFGADLDKRTLIWKQDVCAHCCYCIASSDPASGWNRQRISQQMEKNTRKQKDKRFALVVRHTKSLDWSKLRELPNKQLPVRGETWSKI